MGYKVLFFIIFLAVQLAAQAQVFKVREGRIDFDSDAPQELIHAFSDDLKGIIDVGKNIYAFKVNIATFKGFNSPLQREHFNENYMETMKYPEASFSGKIIEEVNMSKDGEYTVRAKGKLNIHGVQQERIIYSKVRVKDGTIYVQSDFIVSLSDHDIKIPRLVYKKLASDVNVSISTTLIPQ